MTKGRSTATATSSRSRNPSDDCGPQHPGRRRRVEQPRERRQRDRRDDGVGCEGPLAVGSLGDHLAHAAGLVAHPGHPGVAEDPAARRELLGEALADAADAEARVGEAVDETGDGAAVLAREGVADRPAEREPLDPPRHPADADALAGQAPDLLAVLLEIDREERAAEAAHHPVLEGDVGAAAGDARAPARRPSRRGRAAAVPGPSAASALSGPQRVIDVAPAQQDLARARHVDELVAHEPPRRGRRPPGRA